MEVDYKSLTFEDGVNAGWLTSLLAGTAIPYVALCQFGLLEPNDALVEHLKGPMAFVATPEGKRLVVAFGLLQHDLGIAQLKDYLAKREVADATAAPR